ncbi:MAG: hypothetical protein KAX49_13695 [Halanaerobiales bacterium]|nr:hypothetical protein [Halanaerobiales bacterium]
MAIQFQIKRGVIANVPSIESGEFYFATDTTKLLIGDGSTGGGYITINLLSDAHHTDLTDGNDCGIHKHDDIYYTETELNAGQLDNRYYTETEIDTFAFVKADGSVDLSSNWIISANSITLTAGTLTASTITDGTFSVNGGTITGASISANQVSAGTLDIGANAFTVNSIEIVGADGEVNKAAVEDSGNWDTAYTHSQDNSQAHTDYLINNGDDITSGSLTLQGGTVTLGTTTQIGYVEIYDGSDHKITITAPTNTGGLTSDYTLYLPEDDGVSGEALISDGNGVLSWSSNLTWDGSSLKITANSDSIEFTHDGTNAIFTSSDGGLTLKNSELIANYELTIEASGIGYPILKMKNDNFNFEMLKANSSDGTLRVMPEAGADVSVFAESVSGVCKKFQIYGYPGNGGSLIHTDFYFDPSGGSTASFVMDTPTQWSFMINSGPGLYVTAGIAWCNTFGFASDTDCYLYLEGADSIYMKVGNADVFAWKSDAVWAFKVFGVYYDATHYITLDATVPDIKMKGIKVLGTQQPHIADADGTLPSATSRINAILSAMETHGLLASS